MIQRSLRSIVSASKSIFKKQKMQLSKIHVFSFKTTRVKCKIHLNQIDNSNEVHYLEYFTHSFVMSHRLAHPLSHCAC